MRPGDEVFVTLYTYRVPKNVLLPIVVVLGATPFSEPSSAPFRRSGFTPFFCAVHGPNPNFLCTGQQKAKQLGYSPLPRNLVEFGFDAVRQIPGAPAPPPIDQCANPTINGQFNLANAPQPPASARAGTPRGAAANTRRSSSNAASGVTDTTVVTAEDLLAAAELEASGGQAAVENAAPASVVGGRDAVPVGVYVTVALVILGTVFGPPLLSAAIRRPD